MGLAGKYSHFDGFRLSPRSARQCKKPSKNAGMASCVPQMDPLFGKKAAMSRGALATCERVKPSAIAHWRVWAMRRCPIGSPCCTPLLLEMFSIPKRTKLRRCGTRRSISSVLGSCDGFHGDLVGDVLQVRGMQQEQVRSAGAGPQASSSTLKKSSDCQNVSDFPAAVDVLDLESTLFCHPHHCLQT